MLESMIYIVGAVVVFYIGISMAFSLLGFFFDVILGLAIGCMWLISRPVVWIAEYLTDRQRKNRSTFQSTGSFSTPPRRSYRRSTPSFTEVWRKQTKRGIHRVEVWTPVKRMWDRCVDFFREEEK